MIKGENMTAGIIVLLIASIIRGWGLLNHRRGPMEAAVIASGPVLAILSIISIAMGLIGAFLIGADTSFWIGIIAFVAFWFLSGIWAPILASLGL
jgi:predicted ABC-type exoprotein transport system permease subunit